MQFEKWYDVDVLRPRQLIPDLGFPVFKGDANSVRVGVHMFSNKEPLDVTGSVEGYVLLPNGAMAPVITGEKEGNAAWIDLSELSLAIIGRIQVAIRLVDGEEETVIFCASATVRRVGSETIIDPDNVIPTWDDILDKIAAMDQAAEDCEDAAAAATEAAEHAVQYDAEQTLTDAQKETARGNIEAASEDDVTELKSALSEKTYNIIDSVIRGCSIDSNGAFVANNTYDMWIAPIESDKTYAVLSNDTSGFVYGLYTEKPTVTSVATTGRIITQTFTFTSTLTGYIAFRVMANYPYAQITTGSTARDYIKPISAIDIYAREEIKSLYVGGNVFDPNNTVDGYFIQGTQNNPPEVVTDNLACYYKYPVKGIANKLIISIVNMPTYFGGNIGFIGGNSLTDNIIIKITQPGTTVFTGNWTNADNMFLYVNCLISAKQSFGVYINQDVTRYVAPGEKSILINNSNSPLYGKKLCVSGDSIMYGAGSTGGFAKPIADVYHMRLQNIAVSGGTIASGTVDGNGNNRFWIAENMGSLDNDGDYYIINGGLNDYNLNVPLFPNGENAPRNYILQTEPTDINVFSQAMENVCYNLVVNHTSKKYGFMFPHRTGYYDWTNNQIGQNYKYYKDIQKTILKKWGVPYIDIGEISGMDTIFNEIAEAYTANADRAHPNQAGYELFYIPHIVKWLESL